MIDSVKVNMLGGFSIQSGDRLIDNNDNRSRKVWLLIAFLIYHRKRKIQQEELVKLFWDNDDEDADPTSALKTMLYRARALLDRLGPGAGHQLIIRKEGSYAWNTSVPITVDLDEFDRYYKEGDLAEDDESRLPLYLQALDNYRGEFLPKLSTEVWVMPISVFYSEQYNRTALKTMDILEADSQTDAAARIAKTMLSFDPYSEDACRHLLQDLIAMGRLEEAGTIYESFRDRLYSLFGIQPDEALRNLYRQTLNSVNDTSVSIEEIERQVQEETPMRGALVCEYDFFKILYQSAARSIARSGDSIHIALLSLDGQNGVAMSRAVLDRAMENFQDIIRVNLRNGDIVARCSVSQYIVMLQQANYENSCLVCTRITKAFIRQYPHTQAEVRFTVQPLKPFK